MAFEIAKRLVSDRTVVTTGGTRVRLSIPSLEIFRIDISADIGNTDVVVVGDVNVVAASGSQKGTVLFAGNPSTTIYIDDLNKLYVDAIANGDAVVYTYYSHN